jgi:hypothetical protein
MVFYCWIIALCTGSAVIGGFCLPLIAVVFMIIGKSLSKPDRRGEKPGKAWKSLKGPRIPALKAVS